MKPLKLQALVAALTVLWGGVAAACDRMEKVVAVWLPIMQTTAYYVALEEGLFEKACIEVVSNKLEAPNQIIDALETKFPGLKARLCQGDNVRPGMAVVIDTQMARAGLSESVSENSEVHFGLR